MSTTQSGGDNETFKREPSDERLDERSVRFVANTKAILFYMGRWFPCYSVSYDMSLQNTVSHNSMSLNATQESHITGTLRTDREVSTLMSRHRPSPSTLEVAHEDKVHSFNNAMVTVIQSTGPSEQNKTEVEFAATDVSSKKTYFRKDR